MSGWLRQHRRLSIAGGVFIALIIVAVVGSGTKTKPPTSSSAASTPTPKRPTTNNIAQHPRAPAPHRRSPVVHAAACHAPTDVLAGVYHPYRLHVLAACQRASGTVIGVRHEQDGDLHIDLALVSGYGSLVNGINQSAQGGALVVEFMARDGGHLSAPSVGDHLMLTGAWVHDTDHGWNELHPVWSEQINGGSVNHSGSQYGGSPASDSSSNAEADCQDASGQPCQAYGQRTLSSGSPTTSAGCGSCRPSYGGGSSGPGSSANYRAGEFCSTAKELSYETAGYACTPASDGRERLHHR